MSDTFIRLTDDEGDHFYVNTASITLIGPTGDGDMPTAIRIGGNSVLCAEPITAVLHTLGMDLNLIEVDAA